MNVTSRISGMSHRRERRAWRQPFFVALPGMNPLPKTDLACRNADRTTRAQQNDRAPGYANSC